MELTSTLTHSSHVVEQVEVDGLGVADWPSNA